MILVVWWEVCCFFMHKFYLSWGENVQWVIVCHYVCEVCTICTNVKKAEILMTLHLFLQDPVQEWGEEEEDGAVFGVTLRREPVLPISDTAEPPSTFSFVQYHTVKVRRLKAATLERLVTHLLDLEHQEHDFTRIFLSTYRAFTSTSTLVELLFQRWDTRWERLLFSGNICYQKPPWGLSQLVCKYEIFVTVRLRDQIQRERVILMEFLFLNEYCDILGNTLICFLAESWIWRLMLLVSVWSVWNQSQQLGLAVRLETRGNKGI